MANVQCMTPSLRLMIRMWAHNDPIKIAAVVMVVVEAGSAKAAAKALNCSRRTIELWLSEFRRVMKQTAEDEGLDVRGLVMHRDLCDEN